MSHVLNTGHCRMIILSILPQNYNSYPKLLFFFCTPELPSLPKMTFSFTPELLFVPKIFIFYIRITIVTHFFYTRLTIFTQSYLFITLFPRFTIHSKMSVFTLS